MSGPDGKLAPQANCGAEAQVAAGLHLRGNLLDSIMESVPCAIFAKDLEGRYLSINRAGAAMAGLRPLDFIGRTDAELLEPERAEAARRGDLAVVSSGRERRREETLLVGGESRAYISSTIPWRDDTGRIVGVIGVSVDITERKRAEESLQNERLLLRTVIDNIPETICAKDSALRKILSNPADVFAMGARSEAEVLGKTDYDFYAQEFADFFTAIDSQVMESGEPMLEVEREIPVNVTERRWILGSKIPLKDKAGRIVGVVGITRDITGRRKAEERIKELLAEKELILREVHHRIKNNMASICSLLSIQRATVEDIAAKRALEAAAGRVQSMMVLYERLYLSGDFLNISVGFVLPSLVDEIVANCACPAEIEVEKEVEDFVLDTKRLQPLGIIVNEVLTNAMKYAFAGRARGRVRVKARREGGRARVEIGDDGIGMPEAVGPGRSTGFGLMLVENLSRQLDGEIRVERGGGTRFVLEFPC